MKFNKNMISSLLLVTSVFVTGCAGMVKVPAVTPETATTKIIYQGGLTFSSQDKKLKSSDVGDSAIAGSAAVQMGAPLPVAVLASVLTHITGTSLETKNDIPSGHVRMLLTVDCDNLCPITTYTQPVTVEMLQWKVLSELVWDKTDDGKPFLRLKNPPAVSGPAENKELATSK
jgi:hypothetical protein